MPLTEHQAQQITLVRALEQTQSNDELWSKNDAKEATLSTIELVGSKASFAEFVARRANWVLDTINKRTPNRAIHLEPSQLPMVAGLVLAVMALIGGILTNYLATDLLHPGQINIIVLPLVLLILWNLFSMAWFFVNWVLHLFQHGHQKPSSVVALFGKHMSFSFRFGQRRPEPWFDTFRYDWSQLCGPITATRLKLAANMTSILFAIGVMGNLIVSAAFEHYIAGWKTTLPKLIDAQSVHGFFSWVLAPGSYLFNLPIPDTQHIQSLRMPPSAGEEAEGWVWLYFGSVLAWVIIPRLCLLALNLITQWRFRRNFALPMTTTYFTTLRAAWRGQRIGVSVVPFRYELTPVLRANLETMLRRVYGLTVDITVDRPIFMGDNAKDWKSPIKRDGHVAVLVIFNLSATAESDTQGALLVALRGAIERGTPILPIVDTGAYRQDDPERIRQRHRQWRQTLDRIRYKPLFLNLHNATDDDLKTLNDRLNHDD